MIAKETSLNNRIWINMQNFILGIFLGFFFSFYHHYSVFLTQSLSLLFFYCRNSSITHIFLLMMSWIYQRSKTASAHLGVSFTWFASAHLGVSFTWFASAHLGVSFTWFAHCFCLLCKTPSRPSVATSILKIGHKEHRQII